MAGCGQPGCCHARDPASQLGGDLRLGYGLPLSAMLLASALAAALGHADGIVALAALAGLAGGAWLAGRRHAARAAGRLAAPERTTPAQDAHGLTSR